MAPVWKGALTFGLVHFPVQLQSAVRAGGDRVSFRQLHHKDLSPIKYQRVCEREDEVVPWDSIVKGYEYAKGKFVVVTDDDLKAAAAPTSKEIEILDFAKAGEVDPRYFETPYYLVPEKGGEKAYALLREALRATGMLGIGKFSLRQKQHLVAVRVEGDALVLDVMRFAHELVDPAEYTFPSAEGVRSQELQMAQQLVENLAGDFEPEKYSDDYRDNLMRIIRAKMKGKKVEAKEAEEPEATPVIDLMARLEESLAKARRARSGGAQASKAKQPRPSRARRSSRSSKRDVA